MTKVSHRTLVILSGLVWALVGVFLFSFGIMLILREIQTASNSSHYSALSHLMRFFPDVKVSFAILVTLALMVGYFKGKYVLGKSVNRQVERIYSFTAPVSLKYLYSPGYYFLIGGMCGLGILMRFCPITTSTRGIIDLAIGSALIQGGMLYFRTKKQ